MKATRAYVMVALSLLALSAAGVEAQHAQDAQLTPRTVVGDVPLLATSHAAGYRLQNAPSSAATTRAP